MGSSFKCSLSFDDTPGNIVPPSTQTRHCTLHFFIDARVGNDLIGCEGQLVNILSVLSTRLLNLLLTSIHKSFVFTRFRIDSTFQRVQFAQRLRQLRSRIDDGRFWHFRFQLVHPHFNRFDAFDSLSRQRQSRVEAIVLLRGVGDNTNPGRRKSLADSIHFGQQILIHFWN